MAGRKKIDEKKLLKIALTAFSTKRYEEVSLNEIIEEAGISKGSFYYRYADKYQLYVTLLREAMEKKWEFIFQRIESEVSEDLFDDLKKQVIAAREFTTVYPQYSELAQKFYSEKGTSHWEKAVSDLYREDSSKLGKKIEEELQKGTFTSTYESSFIKRIIPAVLSLHNQMLLPQEDSEELLDQLILFLKSALLNT